MTTIAWDGKTLAVDRCRVSGRGTRQLARKLFEAGDYVFAIAGALSDIPVVERWLATGARWEDRPELDDSGGFAIRKVDCAVFAIDGKRATLVRVPDGPQACGSGGPYAVAAMACGKTAREAVEVAAQFDDGTGFGVDAWDCELVRKVEP